MNKYTSTIVFQVWDDESGEKIEVGEDTDGLNLVEIRSYSDDLKISQGITV